MDDLLPLVAMVTDMDELLLLVAMVTDVDELLPRAAMMKFSAEPSLKVFMMIRAKVTAPTSVLFPVAFCLHGKT